MSCSGMDRSQKDHGALGRQSHAGFYFAGARTVCLASLNWGHALRNSPCIVQVTYEAYGAGGTGFIAECLTDNVNRSATDVRTAITKGGGKMADSGSVVFNFQRCGLVFVQSSSEEEVRGRRLLCGLVKCLKDSEYRRY